MGLIVMWTGTEAALYPGWAICDGNNGTPDLRNFFIMQQSVTHPQDDTGGAINHTHAFTSNNHSHNLNAAAIAAVGASKNFQTDSKQVTGTTNNGSILPPYYALAYVMKL